jgi:hypothetical protein
MWKLYSHKIVRINQFLASFFFELVHRIQKFSFPRKLVFREVDPRLNKEIILHLKLKAICRYLLHYRRLRNLRHFVLVEAKVDVVGGFDVHNAESI